MDEPRVGTGLRELRVKRGIAQRDLAERVGVSRQTLGTLEAGQAVPSTTLALELARALGCRVEDLFWLSEEAAAPLQAVLVGGDRAPANPARPAPPGGERVALAAVEDRWMAHVLDGEGGGALGVPADGLLVATAERRGPGAAPVQPMRESESLRQNLFAAGCDPALALLGGHLGERCQGARLHWIEVGSGTALEMLASGEVNLAGLHLFDEESGEHNVAHVRRRFGARPTVLVNLASWDLGLVVAAGNPRAIRGVADLAREGVRTIGRERGSGSQELFNRLAADEGVPRKAVSVVGVARGHLAVASAVAAGAADAGIATRAAAGSHGLEFLPLAEARFDLVLPRPAATDDARLERLLDVLGSRRFRRDLGALAGYGTTRTGQVIAEVGA